jgi:hypothetical protein
MIQKIKKIANAFHSFKNIDKIISNIAKEVIIDKSAVL